MNFKIDVQWDDEARVWYVEESDVPGLAAEADTVEALNSLLSVRVPELLQLNVPDFGKDQHDRSTYEVVTHRQQDLAVAC